MGAKVSGVSHETQDLHSVLAFVEQVLYLPKNLCQEYTMLQTNLVKELNLISANLCYPFEGWLGQNGSYFRS